MKDEVLIHKIEDLTQGIKRIERAIQLIIRYNPGMIPCAQTKPSIDGHWVYLTEDESEELVDLIYGNNRKIY